MIACPGATIARTYREERLMEYFEDKPSGFVIVLLKRGDLVCESLEKVAREAGLSDGVVTSGIGSLTRAHIHIVKSNDYPPKEEYLRLDGPLEVVQFGGIIANYQPHVHISLWDANRNFYGGHLHDGCEVLALSEISIHRLHDLKLTRRAQDDSGIPLLGRA
jgi:predicted DNA-binding protein with PD1-like motif